MSGPVEKPYGPVPEDMLTEDLLALLSGTERAKDLLSRHGIREVQTLSHAELAAEGLPSGGARRLAGAFELARRLAERRTERAHSTVQVTMRYAHFAPEAGRVAIDALDRRLHPPPPAHPAGDSRVLEDGSSMASDGEHRNLRYLPGRRRTLDHAVVTERVDL